MSIAIRKKPHHKQHSTALASSCLPPSGLWLLAPPRNAPSLPALATSQHPSPRYLPWSVAVGSRRLGARALRAARATTRRAPRALRAARALVGEKRLPPAAMVGTSAASGSRSGATGATPQKSEAENKSDSANESEAENEYGDIDYGPIESTPGTPPLSSSLPSRNGPVESPPLPSRSPPPKPDLPEPAKRPAQNRKRRRQELSGKYRCVVRVSRFGRWRVLLRIAYLSVRFRRVHSSFAPDPVRIGPRINKLRFAFRVSDTTQARRRRLSAGARRRSRSAAAVVARLRARMSTDNPQAPGGPTPGGSPGY